MTKAIKPINNYAVTLLRTTTYSQIVENVRAGGEVEAERLAEEQAKEENWELDDETVEATEIAQTAGEEEDDYGEEDDDDDDDEQENDDAE